MIQIGGIPPPSNRGAWNIDNNPAREKGEKNVVK